MKLVHSALVVHSNVRHIWQTLHCHDRFMVRVWVMKLVHGSTQQWTPSMKAARVTHHFCMYVYIYASCPSMLTETRSRWVWHSQGLEWSLSMAVHSNAHQVWKKQCQDESIFEMKLVHGSQYIVMHMICDRHCTLLRWLWHSQFLECS